PPQPTGRTENPSSCLFYSDLKGARKPLRRILPRGLDKGSNGPMSDVLRTVSALRRLTIVSYTSPPVGAVTMDRERMKYLFRDLTKSDIQLVLKTAKKMVPIAVGTRRSRSLDGRILATLFFEPSTRTRLSFESAMARLGGRVLGFSGTEGTSVQKGETLADTIRMVESYSDAIVLRHPQEGAARLAAEATEPPGISRRGGAGQHPT